MKFILLAASSLPLLGRVLAETAPGGGDWTSYLLNGGPFAIVVLLLVLDKLCTPSERDRLRIELTASHEREEVLNRNIREDFVPLMTKAQESMSRSTEATERMLRYVQVSEKGN